MKCLTPILLLLLVLPYYTVVALHCWRDTTSCNPNFRRHYDSPCDTPQNRLKDLRPYKKYLKGFCKSQKDLIIKIRPRDGPTKLPSGSVCAKNRHSRHAASYAVSLAKAVKRRDPKFARGAIVKCCEGGGLNKGCV
ncbi:hypothetical protein BGX24_006067 [Mortierella sp. AD032]|nr:hypothetical protein BGX24_006067 [Mortierella sp. AD032]